MPSNRLASYSMKLRTSCLFAFFLLFVASARAQSLPVGTPLLEDNWRIRQLRGEANQDVSFCIRPLYERANKRLDSTAFFRGIGFGKEIIAATAKSGLQLLPVTLKQQYNLNFPYGWNDGSMIPARGYQTQLSAGIYFKRGGLSFQLQPEFVFAQNTQFPGFPLEYSDQLWRTYDSIYVGRIDAPERFGKGAYAKFFPGQSSLRYNFDKFSIGASTENLWWGPAVRNALLMSNNAPGFPHLTFSTTAPLRVPFGTLEGQLVSGWLQQSGYLPPDTGRMFNGQPLYRDKTAGDRYLNGMIVAVQPKWTKGLFLGFSRAFYANSRDVKSSFSGYLPVIGHLFKGSVSDAEHEDSLQRDQLFSLFFRLLLPKEGAEVYAEFGRNDHAGNSRDFALEPEHSRAFIVGFKKLFETKSSGNMELMAEFTNLEIPTTMLVRYQQSWYTHYQVRDGYTQLGQVIGAGIGPGGNSQSIGLNWIKGLDKKGILFERVTHNNDFYYTAFSGDRDYWRHWVDLSLLLHKSWQQKHFLYDARLSLIYTLNYQWQSGLDRKNLQGYFSVSYLF